MTTLNTTLPICSISQVTRRTMSFLWSGRLPFGKLAILDGDPGLGKSLVTLDLCARLSAGRPFPDGAPCPSPANSIILNAEDAIDDTIEPRLRALGADLDRIFVLHSADEPDRLPLRFPGQIGALDQMLTQTQAKLVIIDPIVAFLDPAVQLSSDASVRRDPERSAGERVRP
jgi:RecA-family ATPase